jgi:hypothetical protein
MSSGVLGTRFCDHSRMSAACSAEAIGLSMICPSALKNPTEMTVFRISEKRNLRKTESRENQTLVIMMLIVIGRLLVIRRRQGRRRIVNARPAQLMQIFDRCSCDVRGDREKNRHPKRTGPHSVVKHAVRAVHWFSPLWAGVVSYWFVLIRFAFRRAIRNRLPIRPRL